MTHRRRPSATLLTVTALLGAICGSSYGATTKPTVYSDTAIEHERLRGALGDRFMIAAAPALQEFVPAKVTKRTVHPYIRETGRVKIAAVAEVNGRLRDPMIIESTNPRLNLMMRNSMKDWICEPARLNGAAVPAITHCTIEVRRRKGVTIY